MSAPLIELDHVSRRYEVRVATKTKLPGGAVSQMPWRNSSRTPRRTILAVTGLVADPFRVFAYATPGLATRIGLGGVANSLSVMPEPGTD